MTNTTTKKTKKVKKAPTLAQLNKKAKKYDWTVIDLCGMLAIQHDGARPTEYMVTAYSLEAIGKRLEKLMTEWDLEAEGGTQGRFVKKYYWKKSKGITVKAA